MSDYRTDITGLDCDGNIIRVGDSVKRIYGGDCYRPHNSVPCKVNEIYMAYGFYDNGGTVVIGSNCKSGYTSENFRVIKNIKKYLTVREVEVYKEEE